MTRSQPGGVMAIGPGLYTRRRRIADAEPMGDGVDLALRTGSAHGIIANHGYWISGLTVWRPGEAGVRVRYSAAASSQASGRVGRSCRWLVVTARSQGWCDLAVTGDQRSFAAKMRVLVVEDHPRLAAVLAQGLRREGMAVDVASDGAGALARVAVHRYDVVVLDRDLPGVHGDQVCRALVTQRSETRVLMLTAASTIRDRVDGLELGADDYLPKPFDFAELVARIRALGRRAVTPLSPTLARGDLSLDSARRVAFRGERRLALSPKEFALLECLLAADGRVISAEELLARVWDEAANPFTTTVKTTIGRLRAKLGDPPVIETLRESGYRL